MPKQKYTVSVCYHLPYLHDIVVEANSIEEACDLAIEAANDDPNWRTCDEPLASYVDGIYVGETETGRYWDKPDDAPDDPEIPTKYGELGSMYSRATCLAALVDGKFRLAELIEILEAARYDTSDEPLARRNEELVKLLRFAA